MMMRPKRKMRLFLGLLLVAVVCFNGCSRKNEPGKLAKVSLRLQWFHLAQFAGFYCAKENGYYSGNGLDVNIIPGGPDFNPIPLVGSGDETFGVWTADQLLIAQSKGRPITIIAAIFREDPNVLLVKEDSPIHAPKDFIGKKITTVFGRATETVMRALLKRNAIPEKDVIIEPFPYNLISFMEGKVDISAAYSFDHPFQAQKVGFKYRIIKPADYGIKFYSDCIFVRDELIAERPELVQSFISATIRGWEYALSHKEEAVKMVLKISPGLDYESQMFMIQQMEPLMRSENPREIGLLSPESMGAMAEILKEQGQLPAGFQSQRSFDNRFVETYYGKK